MKRRSFLLRLSVPDETDGQAYRLLKLALKRMLRTMGIKCEEAKEDRSEC